MALSNGNILVYDGTQWLSQNGIDLGNNTFYVDSVNHRVGIGTSSPTVTLDVAGVARFTGPVDEQAADGATYIGFNTTPRIVLATGTASENWIFDVYNTRLRFFKHTVEKVCITTHPYLGIGTSAPVSALHVAGGITTAVVAVTTTPYTVLASDSIIRVDSTSGVITINLPSAAGISGRQYTVKRAGGGNNVTVSAVTGQTIENVQTYTLSAVFKYVTVVSNGSYWDIIANN